MIPVLVALIIGAVSGYAVRSIRTDIRPVRLETPPVPVVEPYSNVIPISHAHDCGGLLA